MTRPGRLAGRPEVTIPTDRVSLLADVAEIVSRSHDLDETLANVADLVAKRLDADVCSIYLTDADLRHLTLSATIGLDPNSVHNVRLAFGEGLVGRVAERGEPIAIEHASADPNYRYFPETREERYESFLAAPLVVRGVTSGVLVIQATETRHFDARDIELLQTCTQLLSPVVINAQLLSLVAQTDEQRSSALTELGRSGLPVREGGEARKKTNVELRGIATSRGVAIGPVHKLEDPVDLAHLDYEPNASSGREKRDLQAALGQARHAIDDMRETVGERFGPEFAAVFYTQIQILEDKGFVQSLEQAVEEHGSALEAVRRVVESYRQTFDRIEDPYFRERGADVEDVGRRVMECLLGVRHLNVPLPDGAIVVVDQVVPALFARLEMHKVSAIVSEHGGSTSHGAIFARTLEIPAVTGVAGLREQAREGEKAVVDGDHGRVYLAPDRALEREYQKAQERYAVAVEHLDAVRERPAETRDGHRITLSGNVGLLNDLRLIEKHGAEGIGLFRTELLALAHRGFPSEEEQEQLYDRVSSLIAPRSVTIRTLDIGGDKEIPNVGPAHEENPQLGCRSIRLTLEHKGVFRAQLRAVLRASARGNVRLLFPMISGIGELEQSLALVEEVKGQLDDQGVAFDHELPVGVMIEVPSAALIADALAERCDFFSIGTNDLAQYTLAVDRGNEAVAHLYDPLHPAVLALIDRSVRAAQRANIPISICGEMATNPLAVPLLIGLGIGELSGAPSAVPVVKEIVRALDLGDVKEDARCALATAAARDVHQIAADRLRSCDLLSHPDIGEWLRDML